MEDRYLFRGKRIDNGEWETGSLMMYPDGKCTIANVCENPPDSDPMWRKCLITHDVDPSTICQCTGLKDKNGKLIWENDIVRFDIYKYEKMISSIVSDVQWCDEIWSFSIVVNAENNRGTLGHVLDFNKEVKVIGNKFDNPELLEVQE